MNIPLEAQQPDPGVRHSYPVAIEDAGIGTAFRLLLRTLPYALVRLGILVGCTLGAVVWWLVAFGGAAFLGQHVAGPVGLVWFLVCAAGAGALWKFLLRYVLYVVKCGHIAVLTELVTHDQIGNGGESMFAYGKRVVTERFAQVNVLFAVDLLVKGVVSAFNRSLDWVAQLVPVPGLDSLVQIVNAIVRAATTYIDETLFSYGLARGDDNPWATAKDGLVYYGQNAREVLKTAVWVVVLDKVLTGVAWVACLVPGFLLASIMPGNVAGLAFVVGLLLALNLRSAFLKPLFLIMVMTKFHVSVRNQAIDATWDTRLGSVSDKFKEISENARAWVASPRATG
ncbi:MAG: hypothetical protein A2V77_02340 [Anaeromyxobacter sp. RBG_16_69_14]|nr:MAG: hypothetical protein A2V77_02340 [Anaeromyxobacter sp. RBG_16_69_14]